MRELLRWIVSRCEIPNGKQSAK